MQRSTEGNVVNTAAQSTRIPMEALNRDAVVVVVAITTVGAAVEAATHGVGDSVAATVLAVEEVAAAETNNSKRHKHKICKFQVANNKKNLVNVWDSCTSKSITQANCCVTLSLCFFTPFLPRRTSVMSTPKSAGLNPDEEIDRDTFDYMMRKDVPTLVDSICKHVMATQPTDPALSIAEFLSAKRLGGCGGCALAGRNVGGGWLRIVSPAGIVTGAVDKLPFWPHGGNQLLQPALGENSVYMVLNLSDGTATGDEVGGSSSPKVRRTSTDSFSAQLSSANVGGGHVSEVRKYSSTGHVESTFPLPKAVSCLAVEKEKGHLWAMYRSGGGVVLQKSGNPVRELQGTPLNASIGIQVGDGFYWSMTTKAIEQRDIESGALKQAIHLPDSMLKCNTFLLGVKHLYCAAPNPDGSANYVGVFDMHGRPATNFVPQGGSVLTFDRIRSGLWQTPRHQGSLLSFTNEKGQRTVTMELNRAKNVNLAVDIGAGLLWYYRCDGDDASLLSLLDPIKGGARAELEMPEIVGGVTHLAAL